MSDLLTGDIPESPAATKKKSGVTHLNNRPLIAIGAFIVALLLIAAFALKSMGDRQNKTVEQAEDDYSAVKQNNFVDSYLTDRSDGVIATDIPPPKPPAFLTEDLNSPIKTVSLQKAVEKAPERVVPAVIPACGSEADCQRAKQLKEALVNEQMRMEMLKRTQLENAANDSMRVNFNRSGDPEVGFCTGDDCDSDKEDKEESGKFTQRTPDQIMAGASNNANMMLDLLKARMESAATGNVAPVGAGVIGGMGAGGFNAGAFGGGAGMNAGGVGGGGGLNANGLGGNVIGGVTAKGYAGREVPMVRDYSAGLSSPGGSGGANHGNYGHNNTYLGNSANSQSDYLEQELMDPRSETEIKAGTVIRSILLTGINSDLPGQVIGQVTRNVWDSIDGEYILIPQGTRLIGRYESGISFGQKRLLVAWDRLIYPNGQSIRLEGMGGYDKAGQSGYKGKVNNHYIKAFSSAILFSVVSAGVSKVDGQTAVNTGVFSTESEFKKELGKQISQLSNKYIDRALNISPTLIIKQGYVMNIMVDKDIVLPPYRNMHDQFRSRYVPEEQ